MKTTVIKDCVDWFDTYINDQFPLLDATSLSIAVRHDGELIYSSAHGYANEALRIKATTDTMYRVASNSKMYTSTAIMLLKERNLLHLDDTVSTYLSWICEHEDERWKDVTIRQLLSHMAGVSRDSSKSGFWSLQQSFPDKATYKRAILDDNLVFNPNEQMKYSNYGFSLLGEIIEQVSGEAYDDFIKTNVFDVLNLRHTVTDVITENVREVANGYTKKRLDGVRLPIETLPTHALTPATGFASTPTDMTHFMYEVLSDNGTLLSEQSKRDMKHINAKVKYGRGAKQYYALGLEVGELNGNTTYGHGGGFPGQRTESIIIPALGLSICVVLTGGQLSPMVFVQSLLNALEWFEQSYAVKPKYDLNKFTVRLGHMFGETNYIGYGNSIVAVRSGILPLDFYNSEKLERVDDVTLKVVNTGSFAGPGETIRYEFDSKGAVKYIGDQGAILLPFEKHRKHWLSIDTLSHQSESKLL